MANAAENVIHKCGGARAVADLTGVHVSNVYRWTYPREKGGTGGYIPAAHQRALMSAARERGIELSPADFFEPLAEAS